jgi:ERCC4-type nuclease
LEHTAYCLAKFAQHDKNGLGYVLPLRKDKPKQLLDAQRFVLEGITGVSGEMSTALLRHFGTIRAVAMATAKELQSVPGVGPKTAATIADVLSRPFSEV